MEAYETEEQQIEAFRKWWKENGKMVVFGAVLTVSAAVGGKMWLNHHHAQAEAASVEYEQLLQELAQGNTEAVIKRGSYLVDNYAATPYSDLAALVLAKQRTEAGELPAARARLEWVLEHSAQVELQEIARLRLARIYLQEGNTQQALSMLAALTNNAFSAAVEELKGDVYVVMGNRAAARTAYEKALDQSSQGSDTSLLRMKLDDLGTSDGQGSGQG